MARKYALGVASVPHDDYEAKNDADTLMRAEEIRSDKPRHEKAHHHVKKRFHAAARAMTKGNRFTARSKLGVGQPDTRKG